MRRGQQRGQRRRRAVRRRSVTHGCSCGGFDGVWFRVQRLRVGARLSGVWEDLDVVSAAVDRREQWCFGRRPPPRTVAEVVVRLRPAVRVVVATRLAPVLDTVAWPLAARPLRVLPPTVVADAPMPLLPSRERAWDTSTRCTPPEVVPGPSWPVARPSTASSFTWRLLPPSPQL